MQNGKFPYFLWDVGNLVVCAILKITEYKICAFYYMLSLNDNNNNKKSVIPVVEIKDPRQH